MTQTGPREEEVRPANEIFTLLSEGHGLAVILDALASREEVGDETRNELSARIRKLRIKGFRDANRAPHDRLVETILDAIGEGDHRLAAAILATWMQTHSVLRERAAAHLRERGVDVVDAPPVRFTSCWDTDEWLLERNRMLRDSDGTLAHRDDAALMLSLVSGRFPGPPPVESELFRTWIDTRWDLPRVSAGMARRRGQPGQVDPLHPAGEETRAHRRRRPQDRRPVERDRQRVQRRPGVPGDRPAHVAGPARRTGASDRHARVPDGAPGAAGGVPAVAAAGGLPAGGARTVGSAPGGGGRDPEADGRVAGANGAGQTGAGGGAGGTRSRARCRRGRTAGRDAGRRRPCGRRGADGRTRSSAGRTAHAARGERPAPRQQRGAARRERAAGRTDQGAERADRPQPEDRRAVAAGLCREQEGRRPDDTPVCIDSVGEAVALAREAFGDRLLIKLNSRSNENTPFANPAEVYDALAWLATAHCDGNDNRIGEACSGWTYKTSQREESIAKYREWYETVADGKTWFLGAHIGKGTSRDPRHTIRIGFARDEEGDRVIVGFIGLHQRNRQS